MFLLIIAARHGFRWAVCATMSRTIARIHSMVLGAAMRIVVFRGVGNPSCTNAFFKESRTRALYAGCGRPLAADQTKYRKNTEVARKRTMRIQSISIKTWPSYCTPSKQPISSHAHGCRETPSQFRAGAQEIRSGTDASMRQLVWRFPAAALHAHHASKHKPHRNETKVTQLEDGKELTAYPTSPGVAAPSCGVSSPPCPAAVHHLFQEAPRNCEQRLGRRREVSPGLCKLLSDILVIFCLHNGFREFSYYKRKATRTFLLQNFGSVFCQTSTSSGRQHTA